MEELITPLERINVTGKSLLADTELTFAQERIVQSIVTVTQTLYELVITIPDLTWDKARELLSFETRSHLASIIGYAEVLLDEEGTLSEIQNSHMKAIREDGKLLLERLTKLEQEPPASIINKTDMINSLNTSADDLLKSADILLNGGLEASQQDDINKIRTTTETFKHRLAQMPTDGVMTERYRHDLRSPLNSMIGFAELLLFEEAHDFSDSQREQLDMIRKFALSIIDTLDKLLA